MSIPDPPFLLKFNPSINFVLDQRQTFIQDNRLCHGSAPGAGTPCSLCCYRQAGEGFQEVIYQRCLALEFDNQGIEYLREQEQDVYFKGNIVGTRRADFVVENKFVVELKAKVRLEDVHIAQAKNYTVAYDFPRGLLINFWSKSLEYKLMFNPKYK